VEENKGIKEVKVDNTIKEDKRSGRRGREEY
jgi:hypothetical protein